SSPGERREIVAEADDTLSSASIYGGRIVAHYLHDAHSRLAVFGLDGDAVGDITLPGIVTVTETSGHHDSDVMHFTTTSFTDSGSLWSHDLAADRTTRMPIPRAAVDVDQLVTEQVFVAS